MHAYLPDAPKPLRALLLDVLGTPGISIVASCVVSILLYHGVLALYNVTLHPLARIPGHRLAGMTNLYRVFWCYRNGRSIYYRKVREMHDRFGPVVRISPDEVSLQDPRDCEKIYAAHSNYSKDTDFYRAMGVEHGMFGARDNVQHRRLRAPWQPFFSHGSIKKLEGMIQSKVDLLCTRLELQLRQKGNAPIQDLLHSLSSDIVSQYISPHRVELLRRETEADVRFSQLFSQSRMLWVLSSSAAMFRLMRWLSATLSHRGFFRSIFGRIAQESAAAVDASLRHAKKEPEGDCRRPLAEIVAATHLSCKASGESGMSRDTLIDELHSFTVAGSFNTGTIGATTMYHILSNRVIHQRVREDLESLHGNITQSRVERLPYMAACVKEGLRLGYGPIGRLPRVVPEPGAVFQGHRIPAGYTVGVSSYVQHHNPDIWGDDHEVFNPDRWLEPGRARALGSQLLTFGKDSRRCIGQRLAEATLYVALATILLRFPDVSVHGDYPAGDFDDHFAAVVPPGAVRLTLCRHCCEAEAEGECAGHVGQSHQHC